MHYIAGMRSNAAESEQVQNSLKLSTSLAGLVCHTVLWSPTIFSASPGHSYQLHGYM